MAREGFPVLSRFRAVPPQSFPVRNRCIPNARSRVCATHATHHTSTAMWPTGRLFKSRTGVSEEIFAAVYDRYCGVAPIASREALYNVFAYMKVYPVSDHLSVTAPGFAHGRIKDRIVWLAARMDELNVDESDSLPAPWFPEAGGSIDGLPVYCNMPSSKNKESELYARNFYSGKYNKACVKFDIVINHAGVPLAFFGPFPVRPRSPALFRCFSALLRCFPLLTAVACGFRASCTTQRCSPRTATPYLAGGSCSETRGMWDVRMS